MTKLNHDRPILRYLDNLRRELRHAPAGAIPDDYGGVPVTVVRSGGKQRKRPMPLLNELESEIALAMVEALSAYIEADVAVIATMRTMKGKGKGNTGQAIAARNAAGETLVSVCGRFLLRGIQSKQQGRQTIMNWYGWLQGTFEEMGETGTCSAWETLNDWAMKSASEQVDTLIEQTLTGDGA